MLLLLLLKVDLTLNKKFIEIQAGKELIIPNRRTIEVLLNAEITNYGTLTKNGSGSINSNSNNNYYRDVNRSNSVLLYKTT